MKLSGSPVDRALLPERFSFVNRFGASILKRRIARMNHPRNRWTALTVGLFLLLSSGVAFWQSDWFAVQYGPFMSVRRGQVYWILSPEANPSNIKQLQTLLRRQGISFHLRNVNYDEQRRIRRAQVVIWSPEKQRVMEFEAGTSYSRRPIMPIGFRCDEGNCEVGLVDDRFPARLRESAQAGDPDQDRAKPVPATGIVSDANLMYDLYEVYFLNDLIESNYYGLRSTIIRLRPDYHLDVHRQYQHAVLVYEGREISREALRAIHVRDVKKITVYKGQAAVTRLGDERGRNGLVILSRRVNDEIGRDYHLTHLYQPGIPPPLSEP